MIVPTSDGGVKECRVLGLVQVVMEGYARWAHRYLWHDSPITRNVVMRWIAFLHEDHHRVCPVLRDPPLPLPPLSVSASILPPPPTLLSLSQPCRLVRLLAHRV